MYLFTYTHINKLYDSDKFMNHFFKKYNVVQEEFRCPKTAEWQ